MTVGFRKSDRVVYRDSGGKTLVGTITDIVKDDTGNTTGYVVKLNEGWIVVCSASDLAHLDLGKL